MTTLVLDASAVVAVLADAGPAGAWVMDTVTSAHLAAPALLPFEVANVLRRLELAGRLSADLADLAHADLLDLAVDFWPWGATAATAWPLRGNLTAYDAAYVALAVELGCPLVTLDLRLARSAAALCQVLTPD